MAEATEVVHPQGWGSCVNTIGEKRQKRVTGLWGKHEHNFTTDHCQACAVYSGPSCVGWSHHQ